MGNHTCPWWLGYVLISPMRRWFQDPARIIRPYIHDGMTVLEPGPGMGFFTLELARQVGPRGRVIAVDVQPRMLAKLQQRLTKAGLANRADVRLAQPDSLGLDDLAGKVDFILAFFMVHEMPSASRFFQEAFRVLKPGSSLLLVEPSGHVRKEDFEGQLRAAADTGFVLRERPRIGSNQTALLQTCAS